MPLAVTKVDQLPRATRNKKRSLEATEEWLQLKAKLAEGLKPYEAVYVTFTPEQQRSLGIRTAGRIFREMTLKYVRNLGLQYDVWRYRSEGKEVVAVAGREAAGKVRELVAQQDEAPARKLKTGHKKAAR